MILIINRENKQKLLGGNYKKNIKKWKENKQKIENKEKEYKKCGKIDLIL